MYVKCDECGYDSGDLETAERLADKIVRDGGKMRCHESAKESAALGIPVGWDITCPNGHSGECIHLD